MSKYEDMSDSEFTNLLESKLSESNWSVGELVELERRGFDIVDPESELSAALLKKRAEFTAAVNKALEPYSKNFQILSDSISKFKNLQVGNVVTLNPGIENQVFSASAMAEDLVSREVVGVLRASHGILEGIHKQGRRGWFEWSIFTFTLIAALFPIASYFF